ncbi:unnamed protein product [Mucor hiemalis]
MSSLENPIFCQNTRLKTSPPSSLPLEEKAHDDILNLQKFYNVNTNEHKRISLLMEDTNNDQQKNVEYINLKQAPGAELSAIGAMMDRNIKKTLWVDDPLRLNLEATAAIEEVEETEQGNTEEAEELTDERFPFHHLEELPYHFKPTSKQLESNLLDALYVVMDFPIFTPKSFFSDNIDHSEYLMLALQLPFATAAFVPPTPPPKQVTNTPAMPPPIILPPEMYEIHDDDPSEANYEFNYNNHWLYSRDEDQSTLMTFSPRMSTTGNSLHYYDAEEGSKDFTDETWEAIFHPLSTFKHKKGKLEYYTWNLTNLPVSAARAAHRVTHPKAFGPDSDVLVPSSEEAVQAEATLPQLAPTPPLKPSPVLTIIDDDLKDSQLTLLIPEDDGRYYDMLQNIRGNQRYSNASSLASSLVSNTTTLEDETHRSSRKPSRMHLITSVFNVNINPKLNKEDQYNTYGGDEETPVTTQAMMRDPEDGLKVENGYWTSKKLFWTGFMCPLLWYYGCFNFTAASKARHVNEILWQKRCRLASIYFSVVLSIVVMVVVVKSVGAAGARQAQSDTIRAVIAN